MNRATLVIGALISFIFGLMMVGNVLPDAIDSTIAENFDENFSVTTEVAETSAICELTYPHYYEDTSHMAVLSDSGSDSAAIMDYDSDTYEVTVGGLAESESRILNVDYYRERDNEAFTYFNTFMTIVPFLIGIGLIWQLIRSFIS